MVVSLNRWVQGIHTPNHRRPENPTSINSAFPKNQGIHTFCPFKTGSIRAVQRASPANTCFLAHLQGIHTHSRAFSCFHPGVYTFVHFRAKLSWRIYYIIFFLWEVPGKGLQGIHDQIGTDSTSFPPFQSPIISNPGQSLGFLRVSRPIYFLCLS